MAIGHPTSPIHRRRPHQSSTMGLSILTNPNSVNNTRNSRHHAIITAQNNNSHPQRNINRLSNRVITSNLKRNIIINGRHIRSHGIRPNPLQRNHRNRHLNTHVRRMLRNFLSRTISRQFTIKRNTYSINKIQVYGPRSTTPKFGPLVLRS